VTVAALRELRVHEQFQAEVASTRRAASAFGVRDEAAMRTQYNTLLRQLHTHATVDGYRNDQLSGQSMVTGKRTFAKRCLYNGMFAYFKAVCETWGGTVMHCPGRRDDLPVRKGRPNASLGFATFFRPRPVRGTGLLFDYSLGVSCRSGSLVKM
jgi:hypothetical protein